MKNAKELVNELIELIDNHSGELDYEWFEKKKMLEQERDIMPDTFVNRHVLKLNIIELRKKLRLDWKKVKVFNFK